MTTYKVDDLAERGHQPLMRWLLPVIRNGGTITYGEVKRRLEKLLGIPIIFSVHIGHVAGLLMHRIQEVQPDAPLINSLVVRGEGLPGYGAGPFFAERYGRPRYAKYNKLPIAERRSVFSRASDEIYAFDDWNEIYERVFGKKPPRKQEYPEGTERDGRSPDGHGGWGGEGKLHKNLKTWVKANPAIVDPSMVGCRAEDEVRLLSGDSVDVCYFAPGQITVIEVKSRKSNELDLQRGIYQCIKYREVMKAQHSQRKVRVDSLLVTEEELTRDLMREAKRHKVPVFVAPLKRK